VAPKQIYSVKRDNRVLASYLPFIREEALDVEISTLLKPFTLRSDWADEMLAKLEGERKSIAQSSVALVAQRRTEIEKINLRLQKLLDSFLDEIIDRSTYVEKKAKLLSQRKSLEEQKDRLTAGRADWLEPFQRWILDSKSTEQIALTGSLQEKRVHASKIFGSNLVLDCKKARGSTALPWSLLVEKSLTGGMVPVVRLELTRLFTVPGF
jgi:hypothetical protein